MSRDHPLAGSGQDPRVKVGTTSILGGQSQGPRMRAGPPQFGEVRVAPQGESRDTPCGQRLRAFPQLAPRIHLSVPLHHRKPPCGQQGPWSPSRVRGRCLELWGEPEWGGALCNSWRAARVEAMPWAGAGAGAAAAARWAWGPALCLHRLLICRSHRVPESPGLCPGTCRGWAPAPTLPPEPAFSPRCSALELCVCLGTTTRPLPQSPGSRCPAASLAASSPAHGPSLSVGLLPGWGEQIHSWRSTRPPAPLYSSCPSEWGLCTWRSTRSTQDPQPRPLCTPLSVL